MVDSNSDGTIVNPGAEYVREPDEDEVGDIGDEANDLRFSEEQQLINEQSHAVDEKDGKDAEGKA